jgi:hypothetical protein
MPNFLRTAGPAGTWHSLAFTCVVSAGISGQKTAFKAGKSWLHMINDTIGVVYDDVSLGDRGVLVYEAEKADVPKKLGSTEVFVAGDKVYWDPTDGYVTPTWASGRYLIGIALESAGATESVIMIDLKGAAAKAEA